MADFLGFERGSTERGTADGISFLGVEAPGILDTLDPTVTLVSPPDMSMLQRTTPIIIDVVDERLLGYHVIMCEYPDSFRLYEVVFDGETDANNIPIPRGAYSLTRTVVTGGFRYTFVRVGGWLSRPVLRVHAANGIIT